MTLTSRELGQARTRAERARARRARVTREFEPVAPEERPRPIRSRRPRRRFEVALPVSAGAQVRLPALPSVHLGPRLLSAALLAATLFAIQHAFTAPGFRVAEAAVVGARLISPAQARSIAAVDDVPVFLVDPQAAKLRLEAHPEVASARVIARWPNGVEIDLQERHPMVEWEDAGKAWWISSEGIAYLKRGDWPGVVHVQSTTRSLLISQDPLAPVIDPALMRAAAVLDAALSNAPELGFDPDHGFTYQDPQGRVVYFGTGGDMVMKVRVYQAIAQRLDTGSQPAVVISVEDENAPYYGQKR
jgi:hypothetical protein